jgi:hypothetical protein
VNLLPPGRYPARSLRERSVRPALALSLLFVLACSGTAQNGPAAGSRDSRSASAPAKASPDAVARDTAGVPIVPILSRYEVLAVYEVPPVAGPRADYSGVTVAEADSNGVTLWLVDDKAAKVEEAVYQVRLDLSGRPRTDVITLQPVRVPVRNPNGIPTGDDIEDLGWLPGDGRAPGLLAVVGERGPGDAPVSWFYLLAPDGAGFRLVRSGVASPPGESVGNDGMEGVALRRGSGGLVELYLFKERPAPVYARLFLLASESVGYTLAPGRADTLFRMPAFSTQAGASFDPSGDAVTIIDRQRRMLGIESPLAGRVGLEPRPREWINYTAVDSLLEGRDEDTPPSLFGVVEGIAEDRVGRLYLLSDNNEVRHSRLLVLRSRRP